VAAGSILRRDYPQDNQLIFAPAPAGSVREFTPAAYPNIRRVLENNILYLANLKALEAWYRQVRKAFFEATEFGPLMYAGVLDQLALARKERLKRLGAMAQKAVAPVSTDRKPASTRTAFYERLTSMEGVFSGNDLNDETKRSCDAFLGDFQRASGNDRTHYIGTIQHLPPEVAAKGVVWLNSLVGDLCERTAIAVPSLNLFKK
jgi:UDP-N-acetylglucosamine/UDP-N-acetylgalactosamine diphosphorylase